MKFYFQWVNEFDQNQELKFDESVNIVSVNISQKEGEFAIAKIKLNKQEDIVSKKFASIGIKTDLSDSIEIIFTGKIITIPLNEDNNFMILELISQPENYFQKLEKLITSNKNKPYFDELICDDNEEKEILESTGKLFYWDKVTGEVILSCVVKGERIFDVGLNYVPASFNLKYLSDPIDEIDIFISGYFFKDSSISVDLYQKIAQHFNGETFSGDDFIKKFNKIVQKINDSRNYTVIDSAIEILRSQKFSKKIQNKTVYLKKSYLSGRLDINYYCSQKMLEKFHIKVINEHTGHKSHKTKKLNFNLGDLTHLVDEGTSSFFNSIRGTELIEHVLLRALSYVKYSSRAINVSVIGAVEDFYKISVNDSVMLENLGFAKKRIIGKVVQTELFADFKKKYIKLVIGVSLGKGNICDDKEFLSSLKSTDYHTVSDEKQNQINNEILHNIKILGTSDLQQRNLIDSDFDDIAEFSKTANKLKTDIVLKLKDVSNSCILHSEIFANEIITSSINSIDFIDK